MKIFMHINARDQSPSLKFCFILQYPPWLAFEFEFLSFKRMEANTFLGTICWQNVGGWIKRYKKYSRSYAILITFKPTKSLLVMAMEKSERMNSSEWWVSHLSNLWHRNRMIFEKKLKKIFRNSKWWLHLGWKVGICLWPDRQGILEINSRRFWKICP